MADASLLASQAWLVLLLSLAVTALVFPLVFILSFLYEVLGKKYPKTPKVLLMLVVTFIGVLSALVVIEAYLAYQVPKLVSAAIS